MVAAHSMLGGWRRDPGGAVATLLPASIRFRAMGVLDDAIREHLELKRKHGVPEEELRRQEDEALGPVRREVGQAEEEAVSGNGEAPGEMPEAAVEDTVEPAGEAELAPFDAEASEPEPQPFAEDAAAAVPHGAEPADPLPDPEEPEGTAEPEPEWFERGPEPGLDRPAEGSQRFERESYPAERPPGDDGPAAGEDEPLPDEDLGGESKKAGDVLEDTPDFLEETPEHDRLWFEQKPPRDFDFD
jgi:hypothetical protein